MEDGNNSEEKKLPPTAYKLKKQREKGTVLTSRESVASIVAVVALIYLYARRDSITLKIMELFTLPPNQHELSFEAALEAKAEVILVLGIELLLPFLALVSAVSILTGMVIAGGPLFATEPLMPRMDKINPVTGFKRLFNRRAFVTFLINVFRASLLSAAFGFVLLAALPGLMRAPICGFACATDALESTLLTLVIAAVVLMSMMAILDYLVQRNEFLRQQRMSVTEYKREHKEHEGDPHIAARIKKDQRDFLSAATGAKQSTVIIDNSPTSVIGIRYVPNETPAPLVVVRAKGSDACRRLLSAVSALTVRDAELARDLGRWPVGEFVTDQEMIQRLAPSLQRAVMSQSAGA